MRVTTGTKRKNLRLTGRGLVAIGASVALALGSALFLTGANEPPRDLPNFWDVAGNDELADSIVSHMTDEELLAQILMFGWAGTEPSPLVTDWVAKRSLGNVKIFGWNTDDTMKVASSVTLLQKKAENNRFRIPLFVATDQEGGWIRHIKGRTTETPGNLAIGASGLPADAWYSGFYISRELRALGINLNFAPAVDLYTDHNSTVIGPRSFGEDPESAGILGASFVAGSRAAGVLTTAKHFPGHGDTGSDSHGRLPVIEIGEKTLLARELVPFRDLVEAGVPAIMSGHLSFPLVTGSMEPATFSKYLLGDILRGKLKFDGIIVTDDMMMNGATMYAGSVSRAVELAISAGNNVIESSTTPEFDDALWVNTLARMKKSEDFHAIVADSARRVILAKLTYFKSGNSVPVFPATERIEKLVPDPEGKEFFLSQAVRSVTVVRDKHFPLKESGAGKILVASSFPDFLEAGKRRYPKADTAKLDADLRAKARAHDTVIFCLSGHDSLEALQNLEGACPRIIVISALSPVPLEDVPWIDTAIAVYSYSPWSFTAAFSALAGDFIPEGRMPLKGIK